MALLLLMVLRVAGFGSEATNDRSGLIASQALCSILILITLGIARGLDFGGLSMPDFVSWMRCQHWRLGSHLPFRPATIAWMDVAVALLLTVMMPLHWFNAAYRLHFSILTLAWFVSAVLAGYLIGVTRYLWKARRYWPIYLNLIALGGLILFATHPAQIPLAVFGLYCITRSQIPNILRQAILEDPLRYSIENDPWLNYRDPERSPTEIDFAIAELKPTPRYKVPTIPYAIATAATTAWLAYSLLHRFPTKDARVLLAISASVYACYGLLHVLIHWLNRNGISTELAGAADDCACLFNHPWLYGTRITSVLLCASSPCLLGWTDIEAPIAFAVMLAFAWLLLRLRNVAVMPIQSEATHQSA